MASTVAADHKKLAVKAEKSNFSPEEFKEKASRYDIAVRSYYRLKGVSRGYYVIVGVFKESKNIRRLIQKLNQKDLDAGSFLSPENDLNYVYANRYDSAEDALVAVRSDLDGRYKEAVWIFAIETDPDPVKAPSIQTEVASSLSDIPTTTLTLEPEKERLSPRVVSQSNLQLTEDKAPNQLVKKANNYFRRMWYREAAELYELALLRDPENQDLETIKKAADAHYFNTNMERAYYWYNQLYEIRKDEMSAEDLFKYAHATKGMGKYGRARRLMNLYDKKLEGSPGGQIRREDIRKRKVFLDNILSSEDAFTVKNLKINSRYAEFSPMFYGDMSLVFASSVDSAFFKTRRYKWNDQPYLDLYVAKMNEQSEELRSAVKFSKKINTKYHEAAVTFSPDNQTIYFTRNNSGGKKLKRDKNGVNHLKIYRSHKFEGDWTEAEELPFNGEGFSTGHPALSPDGKALYFVSDRPGSIGGTDIFVVDVFEDGTFSEPRNLGPKINTERRELFPFVNEKTLYFSSDGHAGLGGLDVFEVAYDEEEAVQDVINVGKPVNSNKDDFSFIINEETQKGYFASNRQGGKGDDDLYSFQRLLPEETNENAIAGVVTDLISGENLPDAMVELLDENNIALKEIISADDGSFVFEELDSNTMYRIRVRKDSYLDEEKAMETTENEVVTVDLAMRRLKELITIENGIKKLKTDMIYFDFDKYNIRKDDAEELDQVVQTMQNYPGMIIRIESHTDSRGPSDYNKYLSEKRANSTREYLINRGIDPSRIESAIGYGEERLLNSCDGSVRCSLEAHQLNRRSEFVIVKM